jgi:hypothetical protein
MDVAELRSRIMEIRVYAVERTNRNDHVVTLLDNLLIQLDAEHVEYPEAHLTPNYNG